MKKIKVFILSLFILSMLAMTPMLAAEIGGKSNPFIGWTLSGGALHQKVSTEICSAASRCGKLWISAIDAGSIVVGAIIGAFDLDGYPLTIDADGDTSMQAATDDNIVFEIGGIDKIVFDPNGNVGIGTVTPIKALDVQMPTGADRAIFRVAATGFTNGFLVNYTDAPQSMTYSFLDGNVGIGTASPLELLNVETTSGDARIRLGALTGSDAEIKFYNNNVTQYTIGHDDATDNFVLGTSNVDTPLVSMKKDGNVGIGTTSPAATLHLDGEFKIYDDITQATDTEFGYRIVQSAGDMYFDTKTQGAKKIFFRAGAGAETGGSRTWMVADPTNGDVGIGTVPEAKLDVAFGGLTLLLGADNGATTRTNTVQKLTRIGGYHYTNSEEPVALAFINSENGKSTLSIGGGTSNMNATEVLIFYTAADDVTVTGTERMRIINDGNVGIGTTGDPDSPLSINVATSDTPGDTALTIRDASAVDIEWGFRIQDRSGNKDVLLLEGKDSSVWQTPSLMSWDRKTGFVGVGEDTPAAILETQTASAAYGEGLRITHAFGATSQTSGISFFSTTPVEFARIEQGIHSGGNGGRLMFHTRSTGGGAVVERVRIDTEGNVGIGIITPSEKLEVNAGNIFILGTDGSPRKGLRMQHDTTASNSFWINPISDTVFGIGTTGASPPASGIINITAAGNVGIGTSTPGTTLELNGTLAYTPSSVQTLNAGDTISVNATSIRVVGNAGAVIMTSTPTFSAGTIDGQRFTVWGTNDTNTVKIQDEAQLAGSDVNMPGDFDCIAGQGDNITFEWNATDTEWYAVSECNEI